VCKFTHSALLGARATVTGSAPGLGVVWQHQDLTRSLAAGKDRWYQLYEICSTCAQLLPQEGNAHQNCCCCTTLFLQSLPNLLLTAHMLDRDVIT